MIVSAATATPTDISTQALPAAKSKIGTFFEPGHGGPYGVPDLKGDVLVGADLIGSAEGWASIDDARSALIQPTTGKEAGAVGIFQDGGRFFARSLTKTDGERTWGVMLEGLGNQVELKATDASWVGVVDGDAFVKFG
jgi:hypothetical protein